jgi:flavin-dependent dehydrogenase
VPSRASRITPQHKTERFLEERAVKHGAEIVRGADVLAVHQDGDGVEVWTETDRVRA